MRIGIDIDDTISNTYDILFNYAQKYTIEDIKKEIKQVNRNAITHMYTTTFHNWSKEEERNFFDRYYEEIIKQVEPKLFAVETIKRLKKENEIYIITARFDLNKFNIRETTGEWLTKNGILYDELILNAQNKAKIAKQNNIDIFIDDSIKNCEEISKEKIKTFMMDSIINKEYKNDKIKRVYSWPHLYQEINNLKEVN